MKIEWKRWKKVLLQTAKTAIGSSAAIYLAELLGLEFAASAGSIALLTIVATKWETVRLSLLRIVTFAASAFLVWISISVFGREWAAYGIYIFLLVLICEALGWKSTVSVNAVIGTHFLMTHDFGWKFILNEFLLVVIGISIAVLLNLFHHNNSRRKDIVENMRATEQQLQQILDEIAAYLMNKEMKHNAWKDVRLLEERLHGYISDACEYQNNTFQSHPGYYIDYFEMRMKQCGILHTLHYEMKKIRQMPKQAAIIAEYVLYLREYIAERNAPNEQIEKLEQIFEVMRQEPLPKSRQEFESRAILYHILMDVEEFLMFKRWFVEDLNEEQRKRYWEKEEA